MTRKVLCVDDEENILKALERNLRGEFEIETAPGAPRALEKLAAEGPYAVVVSDLRMPGIDGIRFLSEVRRHYPDTVRLILSGNADLSAAIAAVNEGSVFQFLTKPSNHDTLSNAIARALKQHELIIAERELLEETLNACVATITEVLGLTNPVAFGRTSRIRQYVRHMTQRLKPERAWQFDLAAMLSQIGCVAVPAEILEKISGEIAPTGAEKDTWSNHPAIGASLLARIPRMNTIAEIIRRQMVPLHELEAGKLSPEVILGAQMLMVAIFLDGAVNRGTSREDAIGYMTDHSHIYDPRVVYTLRDVEITLAERESRAIYVRDLQLDMILNEDVWTKDGLFVAPKGQAVSMALFARLRTFSKSRGIVEPFSVLGHARHEVHPMLQNGQRQEALAGQ